MGFNFGASNNTGKLNMNDFLGDETTVQNDEKEIPINLLVPWENQPFKMYSDFKMNELVESIKENGLLSRIIVSPVTGGKYRIIATVKKPSKQITLQRKEVTQLIGDELSNEEISEYFYFCLQRRDILEEWHKMYTEGKTDGSNA